MRQNHGFPFSPGLLVEIHEVQVDEELEGEGPHYEVPRVVGQETDCPAAGEVQFGVAVQPEVGLHAAGEQLAADVFAGIGLYFSSSQGEEGELGQEGDALEVDREGPGDVSHMVIVETGVDSQCQESSREQ